MLLSRATGWVFSSRTHIDTRWIIPGLNFCPSTYGNFTLSTNSPCSLGTFFLTQDNSTAALQATHIHTQDTPPAPHPPWTSYHKPTICSIASQLESTSLNHCQPCSMVTPLPQNLHQFTPLTHIQSIMHHILPRPPILSLAPSWLPTSCSLKTKNICIP